MKHATLIECLKGGWTNRKTKTGQFSIGRVWSHSGLVWENVFPNHESGKQSSRKRVIFGALRLRMCHHWTSCHLYHNTC